MLCTHPQPEILSDFQHGAPSIHFTGLSNDVASQEENTTGDRFPPIMQIENILIV